MCGTAYLTCILPNLSNTHQSSTERLSHYHYMYVHNVVWYVQFQYPDVSGILLPESGKLRSLTSSSELCWNVFLHNLLFAQLVHLLLFCLHLLMLLKMLNVLGMREILELCVLVMVSSLWQLSQRLDLFSTEWNAYFSQ